MVELFHDHRTQPRIAGIADRDDHIAQEARMADALDRTAGEMSAETRFVEPGEIGERRRREIGAGLQLRLAAEAGEFVPRADGEAIVAAVDAIAHRGAELGRDMALVLDRQIGNAAARIETIGRRKGLRRAGVETGAAGAAMILFRRIGRELEAGEDRAEKQP